MFKKRSLMFSAFILLMAAVLVGCGNSNLVAKVNGEGISVEDFENEYYQYAKIYSLQYGEGIMDQEVQEGLTLRDSLKEEVLNKLIMDELILQDAEKRGIEVTEEELDEIKNSQLEMLGGQEAFEEYLEGQGMTEEAFEDVIRKNIIAQKHQETVFEETEITDEKLEEYFEENKEMLEKVEASHILLETEEEAKEVLAKLNAAEPADFATLAEEVSLDKASAVNGGDLGYFGRGKMVEEFESAAFGLEEGETSGVVQSDAGFHIIRVTGKMDTVESLKDEIEEAIKSDEYRSSLESLRNQAKISTFMKNFELDKEKEKMEMPEELNQDEELENKPAEEAENMNENQDSNEAEAEEKEKE